MPTIKTLKSLAYQRNGVNGTPFFSCEVTFMQQSLYPGKFIISLETANDNRRVNIKTCRAVSLSKPAYPWRGDEMGDSINVWFQFRNVDQIEDGIYFWVEKSPADPIGV